MISSRNSAPMVPPRVVTSFSSLCLPPNVSETLPILRHSFSSEQPFAQLNTSSSSPCTLLLQLPCTCDLFLSSSRSPFLFCAFFRLLFSLFPSRPAAAPGPTCANMRGVGPLCELPSARCSRRRPPSTTTSRRICHFRSHPVTRTAGRAAVRGSPSQLSFCIILLVSLHLALSSLVTVVCNNYAFNAGK